MIIANLATYPPRRDAVLGVVERISPQVDRLNVVLNQIDAPLPELEGFDNVHQIIPETDTKDVGKFYPDTTGADYVLMVDDDLIYPPDFVSTAIRMLEELGPSGYMGGFHGSLYHRPKFGFTRPEFDAYRAFNKVEIADHRKVFVFRKEQKESVIVDQIATNAAIMRGRDFPSYAFMKGSQKFVDVRLARWCYKKRIRPVCFAREANWLTDIRFEESIYQGFTKKNPANVAKEIWKYAFKTRGRGEVIGPASGPASGAQE